MSDDARHGDFTASAEARFTRLVQRVTSLEELLAHAQHTIEALSQEMFAQTRRVEAVHQELSRLVHKLDTLRDALPAPPRDLLADKPPHY